MRSDRDNKTDKEREIDDFLSQFETPVEELDHDVNEYLDEKETSKRVHSKEKKSTRKIKYSNRQEIKEKFLYNEKGKVSIKKLFYDCVGIGVALFVLFMFYCLICVTFAPRVNYNDIYSYVDQSSLIYDDAGKHVDSVYFTQNREIIKFDDMPENLINSFVALEDKTFWKHHGFNWIRMVGAVASSVTGGGQISGTSTITQQLARNVFLADIKSVRSIRRKIVEMYYASRIEANMSKEEIIEAYLNTIYLGYGCYGIDAAAKAYFSKEVKDLNLIECAALAALPQAPDSYALVQCVDSTTVSEGDTNIIRREPDTYIANDLAIERRKICLQLMMNQGYINKSEYNSNVDLELIDFIDPTFYEGNGNNSYFHEYLVDTVIEDLMNKYDLEYEEAERMIYTQGLKIYSTMDSKAQKVVIKEFKNSANYPGVSGIYDQDSQGNIVNNGLILLYKYSNLFNSNGDFILTKKEGIINSDGSITVKRGGRLNIYTTTVAGETDYSLEFKQSYTIENGILYSIPGGYINIPAEYKTLDKNENLVISADFFNDYPDEILIKDNKIVVTKNAYSLPQKTIQPQSAMVIVGVGTGEIKAMVGGRSTKGERLLNRALNARQPGSSIKPLAVYGAALQKSYELSQSGQKWTYTDYGVDRQGTKGYGDYITTHSSVADESTHVNGKSWPYNSNNRFTGSNTFMTAIQQSINTCAFKIQLQVGADFSAKMLEKYGLSTVITDETEEVNDMNPAALALGGMSNGVMPIEMALAYSAFPGGGKVNTPICYTKVVDKKGEVVLEGKSEQSEAMNEGVAWIMQEVLKSVVTNGIATAAYVDNVQSGGKTGTTNDQYDIWFDGFTPTYAASLWIGTDNNIKMSTMSGPAAALWGKIMRQIPKACTGQYAVKPANVIQKNGYYFTVGTENGLSKYNAGEDKKMEKEARDLAYQAWLEERENHKTWVIDQEGHYEWIETEEWETAPVTDPETGEIITPGIHKKEQVWVEETGHWQYKPGWQKGDFKWDGIIPDEIKKKYENQ